MDMNNSEKSQGLDKYKDEGNRYIFFLFSYQKKSNCLIDLGKD